MTVPLAQPIVPTDKNVYIFNVEVQGGFIDGHPNAVPKHLLANPFAVAHYVNHPPHNIPPNTRPVSFWWHDIYTSCSASNESPSSTISTQSNSGSYQEFLSRYASTILGSGPWFADPITGDVVNIVQNTEDPIPVAGVALEAVRDIMVGEELFFDYQLVSTARPDWYHVPPGSGDN